MGIAFKHFGPATALALAVSATTTWAQDAENPSTIVDQANAKIAEAGCTQDEVMATLETLGATNVAMIKALYSGEQISIPSIPSGDNQADKETLLDMAQVGKCLLVKDAMLLGLSTGFQDLLAPQHQGSAGEEYLNNLSTIMTASIEHPQVKEFAEENDKASGIAFLETARDNLLDILQKEGAAITVQDLGIPSFDFDGN